MSKAGDRILEGAREALSIAKGERPAASITINGHRYVSAESLKGWRLLPEDLETHLGDFWDACVIAQRQAAGEGNEVDASYWVHQLETIKRVRNMLSVRPAEADPVIVSVKPMKLSDGRCDYYVSIARGEREVTPHVFRERFKAEYHVALYRWLLNDGEEPDLMAFKQDEWPARKFTEEEMRLFAAIGQEPKSEG